jgi:hypothetical protein
VNASDNLHLNLRRLKSVVLIGFFALLLLFSALRVGGVVGSYGFRDCDTCWLLATGRLIYEDRRLPASDPFSFTLPLFAKAGQPQPFVLHQWLSELLFYLSVKAGGLFGLTLLATIILVNAFLTLILRLTIRQGAPLFCSLTSVTLAAWAAGFRFLVRPEIFTCLALVLWLWILDEMRKQVVRQDKLSSSIPLMLAGSVLMIVWANLHSGFASAILLLVLYLAIASAEWLVKSRKTQYPYRLPLLLFLVCALSTLINPYGIKLWFYLPRLFFSPIGRFVDEMRPFALSDFKIQEVYPFFALSLVAIWLVCLKHFSKRGKDAPCSLVKSGVDPRWYDAAVVLVAILVPLRTMRFIVFSVLILVSESAVLFGQIGKQDLVAAGQIEAFKEVNELKASAQKGDQLQESTSKGTLPQYQKPQISVINKLHDWSKPLGTIFCGHGIPIYLTVNVVAVAGLLSAVYAQPLRLPQPTPNFIPPFRAVRAIQCLSPSGRIFSEDRISDMLIWYLNPVNKLFIDTRLDLFGESIMLDYFRILYAQSNYLKLLDEYCINWVFVTPRCRLAATLAQASGWTRVYRDRTAVIFRRSPEIEIHESTYHRQGGQN